MTIADFVTNLWLNDSNGSHDVPMDLSTARTDLENFRDFDLPEDITPEAYMAAWNELVEEYKNQLTENEEDDHTMKRISIDNGANYITPEEAVRSGLWDAIVNFMDDDTREAVAYEGYDDNVAFLTRYLELADDDLIIG